MFEGYRIVCLTAVTTHRYLSILLQYIVSSPIVDEYRLFLNDAHREKEILYCRDLQKQSSKIFVEVKDCLTTEFYRNCADEKTIYVRFEDDIVFVEFDFFWRFLRFRVENPQYFLVAPNIINNQLCVQLQTEYGPIAPEKTHPWSLEHIGWRRARFAEQLHRAFLESVTSGSCADWHFGPHVIAGQKPALQCASWFGEDLARMVGDLPDCDEDEWPRSTGLSESLKPNCIFGDATVSHFAHSSQREHLESTELLGRYSALVKQAPPNELSSVGPPQKINLWMPRLLAAIGNLGCASMSELTDPEYVAVQVRLAGLVGDDRFLYGSDNQFMNTGGEGLWQIPMQLARCLVKLSPYEISSAIEIGTWTGWTTAFVAAYLARLNSYFHMTTVDVHDHFECYPVLRGVVPIIFHVGTSADFAGRTFDLAFIDGDHRYNTCRPDYEAVGSRSPICMFHDINDQFVSQYKPNEGGVPRLWRELKSRLQEPDQAYEFLDHSHGRPAMGIGMIVRARAVGFRAEEIRAPRG